MKVSVNIKVITPFKDGEFIPIIDLWLRQFEGVTFFNGKGLPPSGWDLRQHGLELYRNDDVYLHWMDDDTLLNPEIYDWLKSNSHLLTSPKVIIFGQRWWCNGIKRLNASAENCVPVKCDVGQLFVHASLTEGINWGTRYENDGDFIYELHQKHSDKFIFVNEVDSWYNALQPNKGLFNNQIITIA